MYGPPIELGWDYHCEGRLRLSTYERERQGRRRKSTLYFSQVRRESMLKEANYTPGDLERAIRRKDSTRRKRKMSNILLNPATKLHMMIRNERRIKKLGRAKKNLEQLQRDGLFHAHSAIYESWWRVPDLVYCRQH